jgi:hypothetical protein
MFATYAFSVIYPCYMEIGMKARRRMEFISVELVGGTELAASVEKPSRREHVVMQPCERTLMLHLEFNFYSSLFF